jgi:hypothetical protein
MKKEEVPQDKSNLASANMRELCYAVDKEGNYTTALSTGWDPKTIALDNHMQDLKEREEDARNQVRDGLASPILYFMEVKRMDLSVLAGYVGMWGWRVKRHLKPGVFKRLSDRILKKYADVFEISVEELKSFNQ